jgi:hypothetical protein
MKANIPTFLLSLAIAAVIQILVHMWLNRFKVKIKRLVLLLIYSLGFAAVITFASFFQNSIPLALYIIIVLAILGPVLGKEVYSVIKKRQPAIIVILLVLGIIPCTMVPYIPDFNLKFISMGIGLVFLISFFLYLRKYPYLNPMWLESLIIDTAAAIDKNCKYTPRPVIVERAADKTWTTGYIGLQIIIKKDKTVVRMSRKLHKQLGCPNMEEFSAAIVMSLFKNMEKENKESS